jgi:hypothetical protein
MWFHMCNEKNHHMKHGYNQLKIYESKDVVTKMFWKNKL